MSATARKNAWMAKKLKKDRHLTRPIGVRLDEDLVERIRGIAKENRRTLTAEVAIALERHAKDPKPPTDVK